MLRANSRPSGRCIGPKWVHLPAGECLGEERRAAKLGFRGLLANWEKLSSRPWLPELLGYEETERSRKSLERRVKGTSIGAFKPMTDFD